MKVLSYVNGKEIQREKEDLDYIEFDVVKDLVRSLEPLENNPDARVEVDLSHPENPGFNLVNCSKQFEKRFFDLLRNRRVKY
jgi:hypothetical protein